MMKSWVYHVDDYYAPKAIDIIIPQRNMNLLRICNDGIEYKYSN